MDHLSQEARNACQAHRSNDRKADTETVSVVVRHFRPHFVVKKSQKLARHGMEYLRSTARSRSLLLISLSFTFVIVAAFTPTVLEHLSPTRQLTEVQDVLPDDIHDQLPSKTVTPKTDTPAQSQPTEVKPTPIVVSPTSLAPVYYRISTTQHVVFLGIDDGLVKSDQALVYITEHHYPFTLFLTNSIAGNDYGYFRRLVAEAGNTVENHTLTHPQLPKLSYEAQRKEICGQSDIIAKQFGRRPTFLRPPYGEYNDNTRRAATACGIKAIIQWHAKVNGGSIQYQVGDHFLPGDIILMHFRPEIMDDLRAFTTEVDSQGLAVGRLEDWIK